MRLSLGNNMRLRHAVPLECQVITAVGIGADSIDTGYQRLGFAVNSYRRFYAFAYFKGNNATLPSRISSPYDCPLLFFWT